VFLIVAILLIIIIVVIVIVVISNRESTVFWNFFQGRVPRVSTAWAP
jgi:hypothetical protein